MKSFLATETKVTIFDNGKTHVISESHPNYEKIRQALIDDDWSNVTEWIDIPKDIENYAQGAVEIRGNDVFYNDVRINSALTTRIVKMKTEGFSINPMCMFLDNLMQNPSKRAVDELYGFLEASDLPITDDGHFLAYKRVVRVDDKLVDIYTRKIDNSIGETPSMQRNQVDDNKDNTCSEGLHFCSMSYLPHYGWGNGCVVVIVKINPADVVSIPTDYNNAKGRCCLYEVMEEHKFDDYTEFFSTSVHNVKTKKPTKPWVERPRRPDGTFMSKAEIEAAAVQPEKTDDKTYDDGYKAGKAKAERHNAKGTGSIEDKSNDSDFADGYWDGYTDHRTKDSTPVATPVVEVKPKGLRDAAGRFVKKVQSVVPTRKRDPKTGRFV